MDVLGSGVSESLLARLNEITLIVLPVSMNASTGVELSRTVMFMNCRIGRWFSLNGASLRAS